MVRELMPSLRTAWSLVWPVAISASTSVLPFGQGEPARVGQGQLATDVGLDRVDLDLIVQCCRDEVAYRMEGAVSPDSRYALDDSHVY
jgi:hypothetical protein